MGVWRCPCRNVSVHLDSEPVATSEEDAKEPLEIVAAELSSIPVPSLSSAKLGMGGVKGEVDFAVEINTVTKDWKSSKLVSCAICSNFVYLVKIGGNDVFINSNLIERTEVDEENAAKDENYSRPWKIVLEDRFQVANSLLEPPDLSDTEAYDMFNSLQKHLQKFLAQEEEAMQERIREFIEQQHREYDELQARSVRDRKVLWNIVSKSLKGRQSSLSSRKGKQHSIGADEVKERLAASMAALNSAAPTPNSSPASVEQSDMSKGLVGNVKPTPPGSPLARGSSTWSRSTPSKHTKEQTAKETSTAERAEKMLREAAAQAAKQQTNFTSSGDTAKDAAVDGTPPMSYPPPSTPAPPPPASPLIDDRHFVMYLQAKPLTLKDSKSAPLFDLDEEMEMGIDDSDDKSKDYSDDEDDEDDDLPPTPPESFEYLATSVPIAIPSGFANFHTTETKGTKSKRQQVAAKRKEEKLMSKTFAEISTMSELASLSGDEEEGDSSRELSKSFAVPMSRTKMMKGFL